MNEIIGLDITQLETLIVDIGESKFRAKQLFSWFHEKLVWDYDDMTNISIPLRTKLKETYPIQKLNIEQKYKSDIDGTTKYLFELPDGNIIESVLMRYKHGNSVCISTQVGCRMGCMFCASTINGLVRDLTVAELLGQVYSIINDIGERVSNVVLMGSGEPFEMLDTVVKFVELINNDKGQNIGQRHITVSTCGIVPEIINLADKNLQITLAISLHAPTDDKRKEIMPIANKYTIEQLLDACKYYTTKTNRRITFEYALILGKNDTKDEATQLANLLKGLLCHVNLIPVNPVAEREFESTSESGVQDFQSVLKSYNIETTIRRKLGEDIEAACGQLRNRYIKNRGDI
ncbi:MAG: 23S rRNA (adenine(2503)-C(2))-methyltransferase [Epulopiscium sp. Nele67-Bin004]|nr:MAG: 23S rRNA (adenine(2503)-C(2))-methyltransferase [Epulopiscium sp. Nele67-Bin004]